MSAIRAHVRFHPCLWREADLEGAQTFGAGWLGARGISDAVLPRAFGLRLQTGHNGAIRSVAWSPDGRCVATGSDDGTVKIWDAESGRALNSLEGHGSWVNSVSWSRDGRRLASGSSDGTVKIWDADSGKDLGTIDLGYGPRSIAWHPDGWWLAISSPSGFSEIWDLEADPPRPLARLYHMPGSGLAATPDGYVSGPPQALEWVRFGCGWALYDLTDVPERLDPERVAAALKPKR